MDWRARLATLLLAMGSGCIDLRGDRPPDAPNATNLPCNGVPDWFCCMYPEDQTCIDKYHTDAGPDAPEPDARETVGEPPDAGTD